MSYEKHNALMKILKAEGQFKCWDMTFTEKLYHGTSDDVLKMIENISLDYYDNKGIYVAYDDDHKLTMEIRKACYDNRVFENNFSWMTYDALKKLGKKFMICANCEGVWVDVIDGLLVKNKKIHYNPDIFAYLYEDEDSCTADLVKILLDYDINVSPISDMPKDDPPGGCNIKSYYYGNLQ